MIKYKDYKPLHVYCTSYTNLYNKIKKDKSIFKLNNFDDHYKIISIAKKNNGVRILTIPDAELKAIQKNISDVFTRALLLLDSKKKCFKLSDGKHYLFENGVSSFGFEKNKNILMNARAHSNHEYFFKTDIKRFFDSFDVGMIKKTVRLAMRLNEESFHKQFLHRFDKIGRNRINRQNFSLFHYSRNRFTKTKIYNYENLLTALLCFRGKLATGSPASPALANLYMRSFDSLLNIWLKNLEVKTGQSFTYTRYADDICISSNKPIPKYIYKYVRKLLKRYKLNMNEEKTVLQTHKAKNVITGINVTPTGQLTVGRHKKEIIKQMLYESLCKGCNCSNHNKIVGNIWFLYQVEPDYCKKMMNKYLDKCPFLSQNSLSPELAHIIKVAKQICDYV